VPTYSDLTDEADDILFIRIMANEGHVLQPLLPDRHSIPYSLRERSHNKTLLNKPTHLNNDNLLIRMLYKHSYYTVSQKNCADLFLLQLRQISTNLDNFWQKDGKEAKIISDGLIFHLT